MVDALVVEGIDGLDVLPLAETRGDAGTALFLGPVDEVVDGEDVLGLVSAVHDGVLVAARVVRHDAVEPVLDPGLVDGVAEELPGSFDEDENRLVVSGPDLGLQASGLEVTQQRLELLTCRVGI